MKAASGGIFKGVGDLIDLKGYTQIADFEDFRFPYRFGKLYSAEVLWPRRFENDTKIENRKKVHFHH